MEGGVRKRGKRWYYYFDAGIVDGKRKKVERVGGNTKKEALDSLRKALNEFECGYIEPKKMSLGDYLIDWLETYVKENKKINTYYRYRSIIYNNIIPSIGGLLLKEIHPIHIENMLSNEKKKGLGGASLQTIYAVINSSLNRAMKLKMINDNPCRFVDRPKRQKFVANTLTLDDINELYSVLDETKYNDYIFKLALKMVLELGLRRGELAGLTWDNLDIDNNLIKVENNLIYSNGHVLMDSTKTKDSDRIIYISDDLINLLKSHKKIQNENKLKYGSYYEKNIFNGIGYDFIITWEKGNYLHPNHYTTKFKRILSKTKIDKHMRFHDLRHTNATLLLSQGVDFKVIQERLGHGDINTTLNIYSHVNKEMQKNASEKLTNLFNGGKSVAK